MYPDLDCRYEVRKIPRGDDWEWAVLEIQHFEKGTNTMMLGVFADEELANEYLKKRLSIYRKEMKRAKKISKKVNEQRTNKSNA